MKLSKPELRALTAELGADGLRAPLLKAKTGVDADTLVRVAVACQRARVDPREVPRIPRTRMK